MVVLGISKDSVASQKKFEEKYGLPFALLSDPEHAVIEAYDVWNLHQYGKCGNDPKALQYLMGHANITMTLNYYAHVTFDSAQAEFFRLVA